MAEMSRSLLAIRGDDTAKSQTQLIEEVTQLRQRLADLEQRDSEHQQTATTLRETLQELKQAYDQTLLYARDLRTEVAERKRAQETQAELERQLHQAQKLEAVGRLAGGIAHDFNNLLTAMMGFSELALNALPADHPASKDIQQVHKITRRAADLTRQLLTFARRQTNQPQVLNLNDVILDSEALLRRLIDDPIDLILLPRQNLRSVRLDPGQIEQVLVNLVINARDAMPDGGTIIIETTNATLDKYDTRQHPQLTPGHYVRLSVSDTGTGMSEAVQTRLFEPFFTTKEPGKGTGLGLAIIHGILEQNHGQIIVSSQPGQGTTFDIYLPQATETATLLPQPSLSPQPRPGTETILLVEDETAIRGLLTQVLGEQGYTILTAINGQEALQVADSQAGQEIHLLLTDTGKPLLKGPGLAERLKAVRPDLKVLLMSGSREPAPISDGSPQPAFLSKPFSPQELIQKVREVLDENSGETNTNQ